MNFEDWYNFEALKIWKEFEKEKNLELMPLLIGNYNIEAKILFVGMNPSYNTKWMDKFFVSDLCPNHLKNNISNELFKWGGVDLESRIQIVKEWEILANKGVYKNYFGKFDIFTEDCGFEEKSWAHLDLFLMRGTEQKKEIKMVYEKSKLNNFGERQSKLLLEAISKNEHKIIVVLNAKASEIICEKIGNKKLETQFLFNDKTFFFSSMLTGQRALDRFSRKRLINEILIHTK